MNHPTVAPLTYQDRIDRLRATKMRHTQEKWRELGSSDMDDLPVLLPPVESRKMTRVVSGSGVLILDALFKDFVAKSNHPSGAFSAPGPAGRISGC